MASIDHTKTKRAVSRNHIKTLREQTSFAFKSFLQKEDVKKNVHPRALEAFKELLEHTLTSIETINNINSALIADVEQE